MTKTIQIRDVPDDVHASLRAQAAAAGESLSGFLLAEVERISRRPAMAEILRRAKGRTEGPTVDQIVAAVRSARGELD